MTDRKRASNRVSVRIGGERYDRERVRDAVGRGSNWTELVKFLMVGGSGYVVNLAVFSVAVALDADFRLAAVIAFVVALANNYALNRRWTFKHDDAVAYQAPRYVAVSLAAFAASLGLLELGVSVLDLPAVAAQAAAILLVAPLNFVGNKVWTFAYARRSLDR